MPSDKENALRLHNEARRKSRGANRPDLIWDDNLAELAHKYAKKLATSGKISHDHHCHHLGQGENLYWYSADSTMAAASKAWIDEKKYYGGERVEEVLHRTNKTQVLHYTQIIWPETTKMGMGLFKAPKGYPLPGTFIVARYAPAGNVLGRSPWR